MKSTLQLLFLLLLSLNLGTFALAAPQIDPNNTNSVLVNGKTFSISGSNFGTKAKAAPIKFDNFENYTEGDTPLKSGSLPQWENPGSASSYPEIDSTRAISGSQSVYSDFLYNKTLNDKDCNFVSANIHFNEVEELYTSYWVYWYNLTGKDGSQSRADFFKMNRFNGEDTPYFGEPFLKPSIWVDYGTPEGVGDPRGYAYYQYGSDKGGAVYKTPGGNSSGFEHGKWHRLEYYVKLSTPSGATNGEHFFYIDGKEQSFNLDGGTAGITRPSDVSGGYNVYHMSMSGCGYAVDDHPFMWQDDIYVDSTQARVELCSGSTWKNRGTCNIQLPTDWSSSHITITVNQGSFSTGQKVYLFVIDKNGSTSDNGIELTISNSTIAPPIKVLIEDQF